MMFGSAVQQGRPPPTCHFCLGSLRGLGLNQASLFVTYGHILRRTHIHWHGFC